MRHVHGGKSLDGVNEIAPNSKLDQPCEPDVGNLFQQGWPLVAA
jgi:hypothetical protein